MPQSVTVSIPTILKPVTTSPAATNFRSAAHRRSQTNLKAQKDLASLRGDHYLDSAKKSLALGDSLNALSLAREGLRLTSGPFYLRVRDQLEDMVTSITM